MTRAALRIAAVPPSPERQALADTIAEAAPLRDAADSARAAAEGARGVLTSAAAAVPVAERAADEARARAVANPGADRAELRALRQAAVDAVDDVAIAREISTKADAAEVEADRALRYAVEAIEAAADRVVAASFPAVFAAAQRAGREAAASAFAVEVIASMADPWSGERHRHEGEAAALAGQIRYGGTDGSAIDAARAAAQAPWRAARTALLDDPGAALPAL